MSALLQALISRFGEPVARKLLGIEKQEQNPKYAISLGNINLNPVSMIQRAGLNQGIKSLMGGNMSSLMGPAALLGGAVMLGRAFDPTRPGSRNYSPNLSGQINYLSGIGGMIGRNPSSGLMQYGPESVLRGQNVMSMFGTNNYQDQLQNKIDYFEDRIEKGKPINKDRYEQAKKEKEDFFEYRADIRDRAKVRSAAPTYTPPNIHSGDGGGGGGGTGSAGRGGASPGSAGPGGSDEMGSFRRGGIASL